MKKQMLIASLLLATLPTSALMAQNTLDNTSTSGSASDANSASQSGAAANNANANTNAYSPDNTNRGIGSSQNDLTSTSTSGANAEANTASNAASYGNQQGQGQGQGQDQSQSANNRQGQDQAQSANNAQDQGQGQTQSSSNDANNSSRNAASNTTSQTNMQGQQATNSQGVTINQTTNAVQRRTTHQEFRTNTAVPLAASSSFSSDYCGGTASGGASAAPLGISIGGAGPVFDKSCQSLRRAEKFGMIAANYQNMNQPEMAMKAMSLMVWSVCTADSQGPKGDRSTAQACKELALLGQGAMSPSDPSTPSVGTPPEAKRPYTMQGNGQPTAEAVSKADSDQRSQKVALTAVGH